VLGFVWLFAASLLIAVGSALGLLGVGGHLLVRARPQTATNITYDPSTIAIASLAPLGLGCMLFLWYWVRARRLGR
jgi:hypothetical protein